MAEIVECRHFNCPHNKDFKCTLEKVKITVVMNELYCEDAGE